MADPLSIAASVAGLVTLADVVFLRLIKYGKSAKNAGSENRRLADEVNLLGGTLSSLCRLADALKDENFESKFRMHHVEACNDTLMEIQDSLKKYSSDLTTKKKATWPFTARRVEELIKDLSRHKETITLALSANSMEALMQLLRDEQAHSAEILTAIKDNTKITSRILEDMERRQVLDYYLVSNPQSNYDMSLKLRHPGTGLWLTRLPEFQHWISTPNSRLWLKGIPGAGKTVLAGVVIEEALNRNTETTPSAFFFCDYNNAATHNTETILRALVYQLAIQKEEAYTKLEQHHQAQHFSGLPKTPDTQSLRNLLQEMTSLFDHVFLTVDGIDECGTHDEDVLETLIAISEATGNISMALLSRNESNIRELLEGDFVSIEIAAHKEDVREYVRAQLGDRIRRRRLHLDNPDLKEEILERLVDGAKGMFRWVACQLDQLALCDSDQECREALNTLPPTLDDTYIRILQRIPKHKAQMVGLLLNCIAYSPTRLTIMQLRELLSIPNNNTIRMPGTIIQERRITQYCSSLLRKATSGPFLEFSHFSVLEFLKGNFTEKCNLNEFHVSKSRAEVLMAIEYLKYVQLDDFKDIPLEKGNISAYMEEKSGRFPLYPVASTEWPEHARFHWDEQRIASLARSLFSPEKTAIFTSWAISFTLVSAKPTEPYEKDRAVAVVVRPTYTPLHLAAALSLSDICIYLLDHGLNPTLRSPIGSPMQCVIQGPLCFDDSSGRSCVFHPYSLGFDKIATTNTINCLQRAGATLNFKCEGPFADESLVNVAFKRANHASSLFLPMTLLLSTPELALEDVECASRYFEKKSDHCMSDLYGSSVRGFVEALSHVTNKSPAHLRLESLVWQEAVYRKLDFILDSTTTDGVCNLSERAFATVRLGNVRALRNVLLNPQFEAAKIRDRDGFSLLHRAAEQRYDKFSLEIIEALLGAGCDISATNDAGDEPLHVWSRGEVRDPVVAYQTVQLLTDKGADCSHQNLKGKNVLHFAIKSSLKLKAILKYQAPGTITEAMEAIDAKGRTPFSRSLIKYQRGEFLKSALILSQHIEFSPAMTKGPYSVLLMAVQANSEQLFNFLLDADIDIPYLDSDGDGPLHYLNPHATGDFVGRLVSLYPSDCDSHGRKGPPLQSYLRAFLEDGTSEANTAIIEQLYTPDSPDFSVWERYASIHTRAWNTKYPHNDELAFLCEKSRSVSQTLVKLGYLTSYESQRKRSGLVPLLEVTLPESWPLELPLIQQVAGESSHWSGFCKSNLGVCLLKAAVDSDVEADYYNSNDSTGEFEKRECTRWLLSNGMSVHDRSEDRSTLEHVVCKSSYNDKGEDQRIQKKEIFDLLVTHAERSRMNETGRSDGMALVHLIGPSGDEWMVEPLVRQGMDPNLPVKDNEQTPALVHHLMKRNFEYAFALLGSGADPCRASQKGFNAVLAASSIGATRFLEEIYLTDETEKRIDWRKTCTFYCSRSRATYCGGNALHLAAGSGNVEILNFYIQHNLYHDLLESTTDMGFRPLHRAALCGKLDAVENLYLQDCNINAEGGDGSNALHLAAKYGHYEVAKYLVQLGCRSTTDYAGRSPLSYAHQSDNRNLIDYLESVDSNSLEGTEHGEIALGVDFGFRAMAARTFEDAIHKNKLALCQSLHRAGCDLDGSLPSCGGCSPLIKAVICQKLGIVNWLLGNNVSMMRPTCEKIGAPTSLHLLIERPALSEFLPKGLQNYLEQGGTFLGESPGLVFTALRTSNITVLQTLLDHLRRNQAHYAKVNRMDSKDVLSMAVNERNMNGISPIHVAAVETENLDAVDLLIGMGADINARDRWSNMPLLAMIQYRKRHVLKIAAYLIAKGALIEQRGDKNFTPLMAACSKGLHRLVENLLEAKADTAVMDQSSNSLLHILASSEWTYNGGHSRIFAILVHQGLNIHSLNADGWSALHLAIFKLSSTSLLINMDIRLEDSSPIPWTWARAPPDLGLLTFLKLARPAINGWLSVMDILLEIGTQIDSHGCPVGSALMAACESGHRNSVIFLTRCGAALSYSSPSGFRSAYIKAKKFPDILKWLLVDRFMDQAKLPVPPTTSDGLVDSDLYDMSYTWGGPIQVELVITGAMERQSMESSRDYWGRLMREKKAWRGKVVPQHPGRRTARPLNLVPQEVVRIHPDGHPVFMIGAP
ncbi:ankyrin repeat-containing domain protein [Apiospora sp. TS-2023a]